MYSQKTSTELPKPFSASQVFGQKTTITSSVFESFENVPAVWYEICDKNDLGMDPKVLHVFQRTLADQCRCWGVTIFDAAGIAIGCAALCLFPTELIESNHPLVVRLRDGIRRFWPNFGRMKVLFCGLPVPSGSSHLRVKSAASYVAVVQEVNRVMERLSHTVGGKLMVFKELGDDSAFSDAVSSLGYIRGVIPPLHVIEGHFSHFENYYDSFKSRYRAQIKRSQKKIKTAGFEIISGRGSAFCAQYFDEHTHQLYVAMQKRAEQKLELMPAAFFRELAQILGDEVLLTLIRRDNKICAFSFSITRGKVHYNLYSGLDYSLNNEGDLYFNLFYNDLDGAFRSSATSIHLGQTSDSFKSRLGTVAEKRYFYAHARSAFFNKILHLFAPLAFPKEVMVEANDVFAET